MGRSLKIVWICGFLVWVGVLGVCFGEASKKPTAGELLVEFGRTQEKLMSFAAKGEGSTVFTDNSSPREELRSQDTLEARGGGTRSCVRSNEWGDIGPTMSFTKDMAYYKSRLWDGSDFYCYDRTTLKDPASKGSVTLVRNQPKDAAARVNKDVITGFPLMTAMGYLPMDANRVDFAIRDSKSIRVRGGTERVGGSECYVIEAKTNTGDYELWIDPSRGYHIAKARLSKRAGHMLANGYVLPEGDSCTSFVRNVRFDKVGDVWIPMEFDYGHIRIRPGGSRYSQSQHFKVTEITINPDHEALKSFVPDDIPDGAEVWIMRGEHPVRYAWRDGKVVDGEGKEVKVIDE